MSAFIPHKVTTLPAAAAWTSDTVYAVSVGVDRFELYITNSAGDAVRKLGGDFLLRSGGELTGDLTSDSSFKMDNGMSVTEITSSDNSQVVLSRYDGTTLNQEALLTSFPTFLLLRKSANGTSPLNDLRIFNTHIQGTTSFRSLEPTTDSHGASTLITKGFADGKYFSKSGGTIDGDTRILNDSPNFWLDSTDPVASPTYELKIQGQTRGSVYYHPGSDRVTITKHAHGVGNATGGTSDTNHLHVYSGYTQSIKEVRSNVPTTDVSGNDVLTTKDYVDSLAAPGVVGAAAAGSTLGLEQGLLARAGQPGLTVLAVGFVTADGKVQGISLGDGNVVEVYATGADFSAGNVLHREFMSLGEPICFTGLSNGAIIQASQGFYGFSEQFDANDVSPMPLLSYGLSFKSTFFFAFRNSDSYDPNGTSSNQGWVHVVNGPLASTVKLTNGSGVTVEGQENIELQPWEYKRFYTNANSEYILDSTNPIMACHNANMDSNPIGRFYDSRLIMPLTNDGITWPRSGFLSAPFNNTDVKFYVRDGASGTINSTAGTGVSPGSPVDFDAPAGVGTGANDSDYEPNGATRVLATGLISGYSGADSAGLEASPLMPTSAMSQVVAQPLFIKDNGDGGNSGVAISSPYKGTAKIYEWDDVAKELVHVVDVPLDRTGVTVNSKEDQKHPTAGLYANETVSGAVTLNGDLKPGVVIADVPITVVVQNGDLAHKPIVRSQGGTTTESLRSNDDETLSLGVTPAILKAEITEGADNVLYRREISGGTETWVVA